MKITFGIITHPSTEQFIPEIVRSIRDQGAPEYEILIVGGTEVSGDDITWIPFNEGVGPGKICQKKNIITNSARYDTIVYSHDYVKYLPNWYQSWSRENSRTVWHVGMNQIRNIDNSRFRDLIIWGDNRNEPQMRVIEPWCSPDGMDFNGSPCLPSYLYDCIKNKKHLMISGTWWIARKELMLKYMLRDELRWAEGEDLEWSIRWRNDPGVNFVFNQYGICKLMKYKDVILPERLHIR